MVEFRSLKDAVYDHISAEITGGRLLPNAEIRERKLCADLQISRTPVREALMQLSHEGHIQHIPRRGFFIPGLSGARVRNIFVILGNLASAAAIDALDSGRLDLPALRGLAAQMDEAMDSSQPDLFNTLRGHFHNTINLASGNDEMVQIIDKYQKILRREEYISQTGASEASANIRQPNTDHWRIIQLLETGDREGLRVFIRDVLWNPNLTNIHEDK